MVLHQPNSLSRIPPLHLPLPLPPHHISPLDCAHSHGQTKNATNTTLAHTPLLVPLQDGDPSPGQTKDTTNTTTAHTPQLVLLQNDDPLHGQSYPLPLRFCPSKILAPPWPNIRHHRCRQYSPVSHICPVRPPPWPIIPHNIHPNLQNRRNAKQRIKAQSWSILDEVSF
jgi:hypothetical protein